MPEHTQLGNEKNELSEIKKKIRKTCSRGVSGGQGRRKRISENKDDSGEGKTSKTSAIAYRRRCGREKQKIPPVMTSSLLAAPRTSSGEEKNSAVSERRRKREGRKEEA